MLCVWLTMRAWDSKVSYNMYLLSFSNPPKKTKRNKKNKTMGCLMGCHTNRLRNKDVFMNLRSKIELFSRKIFCYKQEEEEINQT